MEHKPTVCAVIVTFNRKELLTRTLDALYQQTFAVDHIIVIDNASSDGTQAQLDMLGYLAKPNLTYHLLMSNTGGAGGFHEGVKLAYELGYEWLWLMDDDGYPTIDCLEHLLVHRNQYEFYGPLVLSDKDYATCSFPMTLPTSKVIIRNKKELLEQQANTILEDVLIPFNGVLLSNKLVAKIGYPNAQFFIWGDDIEYTKRAKKFGARIATISNIEFYHPTAPNLGAPMWFGKMQFNDTDSMIKLYCLCRNNTFNLKLYHGNFLALLFIVKTLWFYSFTRPSLTKLRFCLRALSDGFVGDFTRHGQFIGNTFN